METATETIPLTFNKVFLLSLKKPSRNTIEGSEICFANEYVLNCIRKGDPPLLSKELSSVFWLDSNLCEKLELFDKLYPYSKFILIYNESTGLNDPFYKKIFNYFFEDIDFANFLDRRTIKYNDINLPLQDKMPKSNKFIMVDEAFTHEDKVDNFLSLAITNEKLE
tara:strand:- start:1159 stop:1656 length:498 start_codon:yes stop_codon:yes gene_type:complete